MRVINSRPEERIEANYNYNATFYEIQYNAEHTIQASRWEVNREGYCR